MGTSIHVFLQYTHHIHFVFGCICAFVYACIYVISLVYYIYIRTSTYIWHMYLSYLVSMCQHVTNLGYLWNMCSRLQLCIYNQTYWWQWFNYYMSPRPNIMHVLRWHCRSVLPIPWLWLPPSARRMAQIIIEIIIITIIITERGHETRLKSNMCFVLNLWYFVELFFSPPGYLMMAAWILWDTQERPSRIPDAGGPSRSRPWTWPPGTCQSCHEFVAAAPVHVATCFGSGRGAATQGGRKLAVRFWEELLGFLVVPS